MDVKPSLSNGNGNNNGGGQPKQREGTNSGSAGSNTGGASSQGGSTHGSNGGGGGGGLFDVAGQNHPYSTGYENYVDYQNGHQSQSHAFQSASSLSGGGGGGGGGSAKMSAAMNSPHSSSSKPQRTKSRTNAGKTLNIRHGVGFIIWFCVSMFQGFVYSFDPCLISIHFILMQKREKEL